MSLEPLTGLRVVDLFAGSGALGIEALSRGAERADFVERRGPALAVLEANLNALGVRSRARVWTLDLTLGMKPILGVLRAADLILLDPPYQLGYAESAIEILGSADVLRSGARVIVEHHAKESMPREAGLLVIGRERRYGETTITSYVCGTERRGGRL